MTSVLVLGDSHADCLNKKIYPNNDYQFNYEVLAVGGATAQGAVNPNSKTNSIAKFTNHLTKSGKKNFVLIQLGEVDCGFVIWYRSEKHGISIDEQIDLSIGNYKKFLEDVVTKYYAPEQIIVCSATLPTIHDNADKSMLAGQRSSVTASIHERTELTHRYNKRLRKMCQDMNYNWLDLTPDTIDESTGLVHDDWRHPLKTDHHLNPHKVWRLYEQGIKHIMGES